MKNLSLSGVKVMRKHSRVNDLPKALTTECSLDGLYSSTKLKQALNCTVAHLCRKIADTCGTVFSFNIINLFFAPQYCEVNSYFSYPSKTKCPKSFFFPFSVQVKCFSSESLRCKGQLSFLLVEHFFFFLNHFTNPFLMVGSTLALMFLNLRKKPVHQFLRCSFNLSG